MTNTKQQLRGICQCCGRQQAVVNGAMSKHGYTVEQGWFSGVCTGQHYAPMQISRDHADDIIASVRTECIDLRARAAGLKAGTIKPLMAKTGGKIEEAGVSRWKWKDEVVPFANATAHYQREAVQAEVWVAERRAQMGEDFATSLERMANEYHGKALDVVQREAGPAPILIGEKRQGKRVLTVSSIEGARVYWTDAKGFKGWTGTQAFRNMPLV